MWASINPQFKSILVKWALQLKIFLFKKKIFNLPFGFLYTKIKLLLFFPSKFQPALAIILKIKTIVRWAAKLCFHYKTQSFPSACVGRLLALAKTSLSSLIAFYRWLNYNEVSGFWIRGVSFPPSPLPQLYPSCLSHECHIQLRQIWGATISVSSKKKNCLEELLFQHCN